MSLPEWLLPLVGGVVGAATPGLGRGVSLAANIAQLQEESRRRQQANQAAAQLARLFGGQQQAATDPTQGLQQVQQLGAMVGTLRESNPFATLSATPTGQYAQQLQPGVEAYKALAEPQQTTPDPVTFAREYFKAAAAVNPYLAVQMAPSILNAIQPKPQKAVTQKSERLVQVADPNTGNYIWTPASKAVGKPAKLPNTTKETKKSGTLYKVVSKDGKVRWASAEEAAGKPVPPPSWGRTKPQGKTKATTTGKTSITPSQLQAAIKQNDMMLQKLASQLEMAKVAGDDAEAKRLEKRVAALERRGELLSQKFDAMLGLDIPIGNAQQPAEDQAPTGAAPVKKVIRYDKHGRRISTSYGAK